MTAQEIVEEITERIEANKAVRDEYKAKGEYIEEALRESAILELIGLRAFIVGRTEANGPAEKNRREADMIAERGTVLQGDHAGRGRAVKEGDNEIR